ncbi:hypothetical protein GCM10027049_07370 [Mucilaginibacter puniceus]
MYKTDLTVRNPIKQRVNKKALAKLYIVGDSHAQMLAPVFNKASIQLSLNLADETGSGCIIGDNISYIDKNGQVEDDCKKHLTTFFSKVITDTTHKKIIFMGMRSVAYLLPELISREDFPVQGVLFGDKFIENHKDDLVENYFTNLNILIGRLQKANIKVIFMAPIPEMRVSTFKCLYNNSKEECSVSKTQNLQYRSLIMQKLKQLEGQHSNFKIWDIFNQVCTSDICRNVNAGKAIYKDDDHLTEAFSKLLTPFFVAFVKSNFFEK